MEISKLMAVMNTVEEDHRQVLEKLQAIKEALGTLSETEAPLSVLERLREINAGFAQRFARHAKEEESTLFPFLMENLPDEPDLVDTLLREHDEILAKFEEFENCLGMGQELDDILPRAILMDVLAYGWELLDLLDRHAHNETAAVQRCFARYAQTVPGM